MRAKFSTLIYDCRSVVLSHLRPLLAQMFENADVALLEFAEKAESNAAQQRFFEAMKELQNKQYHLEKAFFASVDESFRNFAGGRTRGPRDAFADALAEAGEADLSLVDEQDMDENVAIQNMVTKANLRLGETVHALRQRLAVVVGGRKLATDEIPGGPDQLAEAFAEASEQLDMDPKVKLIVFLLFDRYVLAKTDELYREYNTRLVEAGLLPNLKYEIKRHPNTGLHARSGGPGGALAPGEPEMVPAGAAAPAGGGAHGAPAGGASAGTQTVGEVVFQDICQLLAGRHSGGSAGAGSGAPAAGGVARPGTASVPGAVGGGPGAPAGRPAAQGTEGAGGGYVVMSQPELVGAIEQLQQHQSGTAVALDTLDDQLIPEIQLDKDLIKNIKVTLVEQRNKLFGGKDRRRVATADADIIDLVGMIFEYMLNEKDIPNSVKALLSRLHTPFLKVAILDKHFFTEDQNPARLLLNEMAAAGARWVVEEDLSRGIFPHMRLAVERILEDFHEDLSLFEELLVEFRSKVELMRHTAAVTEQRTREAATGQERLQLARQRAQEEIERLMRGYVLPPAVVELLEQTWADKLMFILLRDKDGEEGQFWKKAIRLAEDIVWSTEPRTNVEARNLLRDELPELQAFIQDGLKMLANFGSSDTAQLYKLICDAQAEALDPIRAQEMAEAPPAVEKPVVEPKAPEVAPQPDPASISPEEKTWLERLDEIEFGTWFDFDHGPDQPRQRLKLAWYTQVAGHYMFVDNLGVKAMVKTRHDLAKELVSGRASVVQPDRRDFLDRAMEAVRGLLRREERISA